MTFNLLVEPEALDDIQQAVDWYNMQKKGLGKRFFNVVRKSFKTLAKNPFFAVRYDNVRCLSVEKFPFLIHYTVDEQNKQIQVFAVINTNRNPDLWIERAENIE